MKPQEISSQGEAYLSIEEYNEKNNHVLRHGFTTGSCALAAAKAALLFLLGEDIQEVHIETPKGIGLRIPIFLQKREKEEALCGIKKYAGDDPDCTDGVIIYARVRMMLPSEHPEILLRGGPGIGRATKQGLPIPPGEAAINPVPQKMIRESLSEMMAEHGIKQDIEVEIFCPQGEELAKKTFNPRLGIEGGISILGTSGFVLPMSKEAILSTMKAEMAVSLRESPYILASPGNYGRRFAKEYFHFKEEKGMECSNYLGFLLDEAVRQNAKGLLLAGHIGKLVKLAGGIMNTHSYESDAKMEILAAHILRAGKKRGKQKQEIEPELEAEPEAELLSLADKVLCANTTTEAITFIEQSGHLGGVMDSLMEKMMFYAGQRIQRAMERFGRKERLAFGILLFGDGADGKKLLAKGGEMELLSEKIREAG